MSSASVTMTPKKQGFSDDLVLYWNTAVVDGVSYNRVSVEAETEQLEDWDAMEANGFTAKCYMPGITTYKILVDGVPVFTSTEKPRYSELNGAVTYSWGDEQQ